jgi:hypothetical protein
MSNPLQGWNIIPRNELNNIVRDSYRYERELRERRDNACREFYKKIENVSNNRRKFQILKEVAAKYGFREEWFISQVQF